MAKDGVQIYAQDSSDRGELKKIPGTDIGGDRFINTLATLAYTNEDGDEYSNVDIQHPLPSDGDSVYMKDLDIDNCTASGFTFDIGSGTEEEVIKDMVSNVFAGKSNDSTTNPKTVYLQFKRPILTSSFGVNSAPGKYFSNMKIVLGQGEHTWTAYDDSADNTQYQIFIVPIEPVKFSSIKITFHTANEIGIGLIGIFKNIEVAARLQARKPDGTITDIDATVGGNLKVAIEEMELDAQTPFLLRVAKGEIAGHTIVDKFGQNENLSTSYQDIWDGGGTYTYPADSTAPITHIYSTGVDTEPIEVQGLDANGTLTIQTKTLTGTTVVALDTPLWRIFRMKNEGTTDILGGSVVHASDSGKVVSYAQIQNGNNQTLMALYTIPLGKKGYLIHGANALVGTNRTYSVNGKMAIRLYSKVFQLKKTFGLSADGSSYMVLPYKLPATIPSLSDIRVSAISSATGGMNTTFQILLIDD